MSRIAARERLLAVYHKQPVDGVPVGIYTRYLPRGTSEREARNFGLGILDFHPVASLIAPPWHTHAGYVSEVRGADLQVRFAFENGERVEVRTYDTPVGSVCQRIRTDPSYGSDWISKYYIQTREDYRVLAYLARHTILRKNEASLRARRSELGDDGVVLGRVDRCPFQKVLIELAGPERFLLDLHSDPDPVLELLDALDRKMDEVFTLALDSEADVIWQPDNITSATTPPNSFKRFCLPFYERHGGECRHADKPYFVHMDGRLKALRDLIERAPIDGVESLSLPETAGDMSLAEAKAAWPDKVVLPNFPASLCLLETAEIEAFLARLVNEARGGAPTMLQFSEDIPCSEWARVVPAVCRYLGCAGKSGVAPPL
ncbi:MAG: uroporphyrinogen decarboxylase family protein [Bryobacteraceae bacterium]|jgi:hypothetical protein